MVRVCSFHVGLAKITCLHSGLEIGNVSRLGSEFAWDHGARKFEPFFALVKSKVPIISMVASISTYGVSAAYELP